MSPNLVSYARALWWMNVVLVTQSCTDDKVT